MSESVNQEPSNHRDSEADDSQSPGYHFVSTFQSMHDLLDKLSLLDYAKQFCSQYKCKPIHRYYFAVQSNPGEQFYAFSCLGAWLIKSKCHVTTQSSLNPQDYEDPSQTIEAILDALRSMAAVVDFPPNRLKPGFGPEVIWVLNSLSDYALKENHQQARGTITVKGLSEATHEEEIAPNEDNELEINFEEQYTLIDEDGQENEFYSGGDALAGGVQAGAGGYAEGERPKEVLLSDTDTSEWRLEVERVLPQLKVVLRGSDHKADWRVHVNEMHVHRQEIQSHFSTTKSSLEKLGAEIHRSLDKVGSREKYLQLQFESLINEYNSLKQHLNQINDNYKLVSGGVTEKSRQLSQLSDELDAIKSEMEERGSSMTDGTPLVSLRKAFLRVKSEITSIDIRVGVAMHTLLQANLAENSLHLLERQQTPIKLQKTTLQKLVF